MKTTPLQCLGLLLMLGACGDDGGSGGVDGDAGDGLGDGGAGVGGGDAGSGCQPPDMLILLDRTQSMASRPDGIEPPDTAAGRAGSKWSIAVASIEALTSELDQTIRFGLALFPLDPGGDLCVTLSQRLGGGRADNPDCQPGEVLVDPAIASAGDVAAAIDPETTVLCNTTPIGAGLGTAVTALGAVQDDIRDQYVLLIGDGRETCDQALPIANTHALARAGIKTFVVGFDGSGDGIDGALLNHMACAGQTAPGFPAGCEADADGDYLAIAPDGPALFMQAEDAEALTETLAAAASQVCCGCVD